eukprot:TRINITY_DN49631_c0_g1_i1.p1 TRINITY_DN49631_c0_g1~~TRINITY_DN49631_c0_g1_i1.p1  ORF type:complete len:112 (+),score=15.44 TRINITY_DN49631_c0_g1_i1:46-336(+)
MDMAMPMVMLKVLGPQHYIPMRAVISTATVHSSKGLCGARRQLDSVARTSAAARPGCSLHLRRNMRVDVGLLVHVHRMRLPLSGGILSGDIGMHRV